MKFQVTKTPWYNEDLAVWRIGLIDDTTPDQMGTVKKCGVHTVAYVEVKPSVPSDDITYLTARALLEGMILIKEYETLKWRKDFGQI